MNSMKYRTAVTCRAGLMIAAWCVAMSAVISAGPGAGEAMAEPTSERPGAESVHSDDDNEESEEEELRGGSLVERERRSLAEMSRTELEEQGFVFEDTLTQRERAHATVFAMTAGAVVPGAGHWHLDDSRTGLALVVVDVSALALLSAGGVLALRPTGYRGIDERRRELWFLGTGLLATSWLTDIVGTAYRDELGIPTSTRRDVGWGVTTGYEYLRPPELTMRHLATVSAGLRTRHLEFEAGTAQELGWGMSDYRVEGRWFPLVGTDRTNRLGVGVEGRFLHYRLDEPFQRADLVVTLDMAFNMGRLFAHLDQMEAGLSVGYGVEGRRWLDDDEWTPMGRKGALIPMRMHLAFNVTDPLRLEMAMQRGTRHWLEPEPSRVGVPEISMSYRSADRFDLLFTAIFGRGSGVEAGLRFWFGE